MALHLEHLNNQLKEICHIFGGSVNPFTHMTKIVFIFLTCGGRAGVIGPTQEPFLFPQN